MATLHISIAAEPIFHIGNVAITNSILSSWIVSAFIIIFAIIAHSKLDKNTKRPKGLQNLVEIIVDALYSLTQDITQDKKKSAIIFPFVGSFFLFIILNNWFGLLPGVGTIGILEGAEEETHTQVVQTVQAVEHEEVITQELHEELPDSAEEVLEEAQHSGNVVEAEHAVTEEGYEEEGAHGGPKFVPIFRGGTADLNTTLTLALISMIMVQVVGLKFQGLSYLQKFINFKEGPIMFFVGLLELISEISKIISFAFRLFGNIFAGEVLLAVIAFLVPILAPVPFIGLEIFVGFIQALVFAMLSLVFMNMATQGHGEHDH